MRLALLVAIAIIVWAGVITISASVLPPDYKQVGSAVVVALAVAIQRINGIQRWLTSPRNRRKEAVETIAQQTLMNLCMARQLTDELLHVSVHVWEVPLWYRKLFPYRMRQFLKRLVRPRPLQFLTRWALRPALRRVVAVGLVKPTPTGVRFCKGVGLIGVCIANNDPTRHVMLRTTSGQYRTALNSQDNSTWQSYGGAVTHNLDLEDAQKLARSYGQVVARVVQEPTSGEAIGCVTLSVRDPASTIVRPANNRDAKRLVDDLALTVAPILAA